MTNAKIGDTIHIIRLAVDKISGLSDPSANEYCDKEGIVEYIDDSGALHGTWGGLAILPEDSYVVVGH